MVKNDECIVLVNGCALVGEATINQLYKVRRIAADAQPTVPLQQMLKMQEFFFKKTTTIILALAKTILRISENKFATSGGLL